MTGDAVVSSWDVRAGGCQQWCKLAFIPRWLPYVWTHLKLLWLISSPLNTLTHRYPHLHIDSVNSCALTHTHTCVLFIGWYFSWPSLLHWQVCVINSHGLSLSRRALCCLSARFKYSLCQVKRFLHSSAVAELLRGEEIVHRSRRLRYEQQNIWSDMQRRKTRCFIQSWAETTKSMNRNYRGCMQRSQFIHRTG